MSVDKKTTITFWEAGSSPEHQAYFKAAIKRFEELTPSIHVEFAQYEFGDAFDTKFNSSIAAGLAPDMIDQGIVSISERADKGHYEPLDKYISSWEDKDDLLPYVFDITTYNDEVYGLGYFPNPMLYAYRKDFFDEAGLDSTRDVLTWEELREAAILTTKKDGDVYERYGWAIPSYAFYELIPFANMNGGEIYDQDQNLTYDTEEWIEALDYFSSLVIDDGVCELVSSASDFDSLSPLVSDKAAISSISVAAYSKAIIDNPEMKDKLQFFTPSKDGKESLWCGAKLLFMTTQSKHKDETWEFMKFLMSSDEMMKRYYELKCPVVKKSISEEYINDNVSLNSAIWKATEIGVAAPKVPWSGLFLFKYLKEASQSVFYGQETAKEALERSVTTLEKEIKSLK
jgi:ABC-type glycerol-3-phosphate transport system substrate-binding protein